MNKEFDRLRALIDMRLARHPVAKAVVVAMLSEVKVFFFQLFQTEIPELYHDLLLKAYGDPPHQKEAKAACWALTTKFLKVFFEELGDVRILASRSVRPWRGDQVRPFPLLHGSRMLPPFAH